MPKRKKKKMNVHTFDGKWNLQIPIYDSQKKTALLALLPVTPAFQLIIHDAQKPPNFDANIGLYADDLLAYVVDLIEKISDEADRKSMWLLLEEQARDCYNLGRCPEGRSTRIAMIIKSLL